jgi:BASS family bile acid:Na+ symporter
LDLATLIPLALKVSIVLTVFAVGLGARALDAVSLLTRPSLLARSLASMYVVMPLVAAGLAAAFEVPRSVEIALVALAVSPVPPLLPRKGLEAGGQASYTFGLLVTADIIRTVRWSRRCAMSSSSGFS